ncbi:tRNA (adenosine(37)-N6)-threonylcarbamoyltransferase complex transferase subunit TsaD [Desulfuribacillus stibiiarsenatis]|uniref:tRNA N6-adenosine threonylcarbamoyltransferase n=1 Tax=Desulfuribacillus stibiiarsenatis TaxID=1390249 RepID=A0A1E5L507_9FIRM|nr:tRNA (adenosine(37)-N6)-threonylcarbamoyltransferase complex transferase subunit TsaD [Desulfuribacillus stibiiarsenatis]OEH85227.1 tRNA (adenosine(37)-N6)-threonylcarbamoyltransferase complex transferase subunit TsaD [Desulfuribacillus stibiiarsenatis]
MSETKAVRQSSMNKSVTILGIETSCDETSAAVVVNGKKELSNVISSQIDIHKRYGGVVPEVASRRHIDNILPVIEEALDKAGITIEEVDAIAVTKGPGLVGALLVGVSVAKALAFAKQKPLIGVHHIAGHIYANQLVVDLQPPYLSLIISGGHTELVKVTDHGVFEILGQTLDDAVGEAFDKVARTIELPYPGGPHIDRLAQTGQASIEFPKAMLEEGSLDFSFSGLKSAVLNYLNKSRMKNEEVNHADIAASFQKAVVDVIVAKTELAMEKMQLSRLVVAGGVAANSGIRQALLATGQQKGWQVNIPPIHYCTDNAAMIAAAAYYLYEKQEFSDMSLNATASLSL